jgi:hypothetical protein
MARQKAKKQGVISDPELIEQFADDPEALALLDAVFVTQSETRLPQGFLHRTKVPSKRRRSRAEVSRGQLAGIFRHRSTLVGATGLVALIVAVAASAVVAVRQFVVFGAAPRATGLIVRDFSALPRVTALQGSGSLTAPARELYTFTPGGRPFHLYAAPTAHGFCWGVSSLGATCVTPNSPVIEPLYSGIPRPGSREPSLVAGAVRGTPTRITVSFEDGSHRGLKLVSVSKPIAAVFFLYRVPSVRWRLGMRPTRVTVFGQHGHVVGVGQLMYESARSPSRP